MHPATKLAFAAGLLLAGGAAAQTPSPHAGPAEPFKFMAAKDVEALTDKPGPGAKTAFLGDHENYYVEYATRSDAGNEAEVHDHWTHYVNILSGEATLSYGGTVINPRNTGPGQVRGGRIGTRFSPIIIPWWIFPGRIIGASLPLIIRGPR
jgi:hypothetical protein